MNPSKYEVIERKALIFNIQRYNTFDGPGVRTLVFFKGCPLRCKWCANPEGLERKYQVMFREDLCTSCGNCVSVCPVNIHTMSPDKKHGVMRNINCLGCRECEKACMTNALAIVGESKTISELLDAVKDDKPFYDVSGGGVTLGGGEVIMQPEAAANLLMACKQNGINTAVETCGYGKPEALFKVAEFTDLFLYDIKHMDSDSHFKYTGVHNNIILDNLKELFRRRYNILIRVPLLCGVNDSTENIQQMIDFLKPFSHMKNFKGIDLLPYHKLSINKYGKLGLEYSLAGDYTMTEENLTRIENMIKEQGLPVTVMRH